VTEPVNLRLVRKRRRREDDSREAEENRARFGRSGAERRTVDGIAAIEERRHAGHRVTPRPDEGQRGEE
jgi:hypothetical protein